MNFCKRFALLVGGIFLLASGSGCGQKPSPTGEKVVKIALAAPLTGDVAAMGQGMKNGAQIAVDEANEKKAVPGVTFELYALDDRADEKEAVSVANQIVTNPDVVAVVGHLNSGCSIPASRVYKQHGLLMISPASTNPKLTLQGYTNVFRLCTTDFVQGSFAGDILFKKLGTRTAAIIHDKTAYGQGIAEEVKKQFEKHGGKTVIFEGINKGDKDFKALLTRIKSLSPQAIFFGGMYQEGGLISKQADELGLGVPIVGGDGIFSPEYMKIGGKATEGDVATMIGVPPEEMSGAGEFLNKYKEKYPNVDFQPYDTYTYDTVKLVIEAIKQTGPDKAKLIETVAQMKYSGIVGETKFDEKGDTLNKTITPYVVKNGKFIVLK